MDFTNFALQQLFPEYNPYKISVPIALVGLHLLGQPWSIFDFSSGRSHLCHDLFLTTRGIPNEFYKQKDDSQI